MDAEWALNVWRQCRRAGMPFYFKQWGTHKESGRMSRGHLYDFIRVAETREFPERG
jgi:protein gp37